MRAMPSSTSLGGLGGIEVAQHRVGADLPDHQIRMHVDARRSAAASSFRGASSPPLPAIDHGDVGGRILPAQLRRQPVRIVEFRRGRAVALRSTTSRTRRSPPARRRRACPRHAAASPSFVTPPFGGRQGTRLKMSPADFATSLTLSIALPARPFCARIGRIDGGDIAGGRVGAAASRHRIWRCRTARPAGRLDACARAAQAVPASAAPVPRQRAAERCNATKRAVTTH